MDKAFEIEGWMVEYHSFTLDVNQFGFANAVEVKYRNGTLIEAYDDLVLVFGEKKMSHVKDDMDRSEAKKFARAELAKHLRDFSLDISATVLHSYKIVPGSFVSLKNPKTGSKEIYYVSGININNSPSSALTCSLNLKYAPENPLVTVIPEIAGAMGGGLYGGQAQGLVDSIGHRLAQFRNRQRFCSSEDCFRRTGQGDCWAASEWLYTEFSKVGVPVRIMAYDRNRPSTSRMHAWVEINVGHGWVEFPYKRYAPQFNGKVGTGTVIVAFPYGRGSVRIAGSGIIPGWSG